MKRDEYAPPSSSENISGAEGKASAATAWPAFAAKILALLRYASANILLILACVALYAGGLAPWLVVVPALLFASFADEAAGDDDQSLAENECLFCILNLYMTIPLVMSLAVLLARFAGAHQGFTDRPLELIGAIWLAGYLFALVGATVAHEFTHRAGDVSRLAAHILLGFTFNGSFVIYHIYVHHRQVGTYNDASTARRGELLRTFLARTLVQQFKQAADIEAARLNKNGQPVWSLHNRMIQAHIPAAIILIAAGLIGGSMGFFAVLIAGIVGRLFHELINFVQHYGVVRVEGTPIRPHHSWDCYRSISNSLHFNLPRHSDHHMFASRPFWQLHAGQPAPMLPYGYQTMAFIVLTPPLWRRIVKPLLADWDARFATQAELAVVRERGWEGSY